MSKKILITGINGFIGSNCAKHFASKGYEVFGIDIAGGMPSNFILGEIDLNNLKAFNQNFDIIVHLAGSGTVGAAEKNPELEYEKTVISTKHLLEYIKNFNSNALLIYSSSAAVYGNLYNRKISEKDPLSPISDYGKQKSEVEQLCKNYSENCGLHIKIIRFFSIYGEGLKKQLLWDFCTRIIQKQKEKSIPCFGTGEEKRDFVHIKDAIQLIEVLINMDNIDFDIINCGTGKGNSVKNVLKLLCKELNFEGGLVFDNIVRKGDPKSIIANVDKAESLGYSPKVILEDGIKEYVKWFKKNN